MRDSEIAELIEHLRGMIGFAEGGEAADLIERLAKERDRARHAVNFFASVIKSGEQWSVACEQALSAALSETR